MMRTAAAEKNLELGGKQSDLRLIEDERHEIIKTHESNRPTNPRPMKTKTSTALPSHPPVFVFDPAAIRDLASGLRLASV